MSASSRRSGSRQSRSRSASNISIRSSRTSSYRNAAQQTSDTGHRSPRRNSSARQRTTSPVSPHPRSPSASPSRAPNRKRFGMNVPNAVPRVPGQWSLLVSENFINNPQAGLTLKTNILKIPSTRKWAPTLAYGEPFWTNARSSMWIWSPNRATVSISFSFLCVYSSFIYWLYISHSFHRLVSSPPSSQLSSYKHRRHSPPISLLSHRLS